MPDPLTIVPGQYTHCVDRTAYKEIPKWYEDGVPSILSFLLCEYLLGGKLVCLDGGRDACAIGVVVSREEVGSKSGFEALDNDFSFNLLLLPFKHQDFTAYLAVPGDPSTFEPHRIRDDVVKSGSPLTPLMVDPNVAAGGPGLPRPREASDPPQGTSPVDGYGALYRRDGGTLLPSDIEGDNLHLLWEKHPQDASLISLPVLHCECEGSRIYFVCKALEPFLDLLRGKVPGLGLPSPGEACHAALDWLPFGIGKAVCSFVEDLVALPLALALAPAMAAAFATAWEAAQAYDDLFITGPIAKQLHIGDVYVVTGRWTWDAGHAGHTEFHPVKTIQRLQRDELPGLLGGHDPRQPLPLEVIDRVRDVRDRWCRLIQEAPPPGLPFGPAGLTPPQVAALTPLQLQVHAEQLQPEHQWSIHPLIDGCLPRGRNPDLR